MSVGAFYESPQALAERVEQSVRSRTSGLVRSLRVEVIGGQVIITGRASTYYAKQLVTHAALGAAEELALSNEVEVC
jgi:hypothetical protein